MFLLRALLKLFWGDICFNKLLQNTWHLLLWKLWLYNVKKFIKLTSNSTQNKQKTQKAQKKKKTSFPKEFVENADFYKPVLNKIMTSHE